MKEVQPGILSTSSQGYYINFTLYTVNNIDMRFPADRQVCLTHSLHIVEHTYFCDLSLGVVLGQVWYQ